MDETSQNLFAQANEALYRKDPGWEDIFEKASAEFGGRVGFRLEAIYQMETELREKRGLGPMSDKHQNSLFEGLDMSPILRTKEK